MFSAIDGEAGGSDTGTRLPGPLGSPIGRNGAPRFIYDRPETADQILTVVGGLGCGSSEDPGTVAR